MNNDFVLGPAVKSLTTRAARKRSMVCIREGAGGHLLLVIAVGS